MNHSEIASFLWSTADLLRDYFKRGKYQDVILPLTVLRRLDCVLAPTKEAVLAEYNKYKGELDNLDSLLKNKSDFAFYNTSKYDFDKLLADAPNLAANLRNFINGFSPNMREVLEKFDFDNTIAKLEESGLLFKVVERFKNVDLHPHVVSNTQMGTIFEELIRKFNEALNENPGEHFTPRDVVHLMVGCLLAGDEEHISKPGVVVTVCDPCCGTGGMLTITKDHINGDGSLLGINPHADVHLFGQEVNPETFAIAKSDLFMKSEDGRDADNIRFGSTLSTDRHAGVKFDYQIANPPYGKDWKQDREDVEAEAEKGFAGRFGAGTPTISDGQLLFLQHMLAHMRPPADGGSRIAIIMNGSPLFTGSAGGGESEIRRWILENDWLEAIIALPGQMFYNTGISTYIWVISNRKPKQRKGRVQLIDASSFWSPMRKSLGDKRREIPRERREEILELLRQPAEGEHVRIYPTTHFGYRKVRVEGPMRYNFRVSEERLARLELDKKFRSLAVSKKKDPAVKATEEAAGEALQESVLKALRTVPARLFLNRETFLTEVRQAFKSAGLKLDAALRKSIVSALSEQDDEADICRDSKGNPEPDSSLRDFETVPLAESVEEYFDREVAPYVPDAWIDTTYTDEKDGGVGRVGYEINLNRYFYEYEPPRPLAEIQKDIRTIESEILVMLGKVAK